MLDVSHMWVYPSVCYHCTWGIAACSDFRRLWGRDRIRLCCEYKSIGDQPSPPPPYSNGVRSLSPRDLCSQLPSTYILLHAMFPSPIYSITRIYKYSLHYSLYYLALVYIPLLCLLCVPSARLHHNSLVPSFIITSANRVVCFILFNVIDSMDYCCWLAWMCTISQSWKFQKGSRDVSLWTNLIFAVEGEGAHE